jgi:hypothetical protein
LGGQSALLTLEFVNYYFFMYKLWDTQKIVNSPIKRYVNEQISHNVFISSLRKRTT